MSSEQGNSKAEIHGLFVGRGVHLGKVAPCLQGMGSESSVPMKLPAGFWAGFLAAESLQSVICASRAGSVTGCYVLVPEIWMVFCGNFGGNTLNITVVSPSQEISQEILLLFEWILGGLISWFFPMDVPPGPSASIQAQCKQFPSLNDLHSRARFCDRAQEREVPIFFFSLTCFLPLGIIHKVSLFSISVSIKL